AKTLKTEYPNAVKIHAGDAITGDLYFSLTQGEADAALMNALCFDTFTLGNHEFDNGDAGLKQFLDFLKKGSCSTAVLSANVHFDEQSPLYRSANEYVQPSIVLHRDGRAIGFIGLTTSRKTKLSSRPDPTTEFSDELEAAQTEIDRL